MNPERWAILDCNSFYCSCERLFRPALRERPVVVLSNNDGCLISVSREAHALGLRVGTPVHEVSELLRQGRVYIFSSNYQLYGDISRRVMHLLDKEFPDVLQYSIDEAFINLSHLPVYEEQPVAHELAKRIHREVGVPVTLGVGATKTLAKLASRWAKKQQACALSLENPRELKSILENTPIIDVWGVGESSALRLKALGINTAWQLREFPNEKIIRKHLSVVGEKIQWELRGVSCRDLGDFSEKKSIMSTRSFGRRVYDRGELEEAVATYVGFACEKLREQKGKARGVAVMLRTQDEEVGQRYRSSQSLLASYTDDTRVFTRESQLLVRELYRPGSAYKKAGVFLFDLVAAREMPLDLFASASPTSDALMKTVDLINQRWGRGAIRMAAAGTKQDWRMLCEHRSDKTQLSWGDLVQVTSEKG